MIPPKKVSGIVIYILTLYEGAEVKTLVALSRLVSV